MKMVDAEQEKQIDDLYAAVRPLILDQHPQTVLSVCGAFCALAIRSCPAEVRSVALINFLATIAMDVAQGDVDEPTVN